MSNIVFNPIIPLAVMIVYSIILIAIVIMNKKNIVVRILIIVLLFIITQRPIIEDTDNKFYKNLDILFVVDTTLSMNSVDVNNITRISAFKNDCKQIMQNFKGSRYSFISFNNYSKVLIPFTDDINILYDIIDNLEVIDPNYAAGSSLDLPYDNTKNLLESSKNKENRQRILFFVSDGESNIKEKTKKDLDIYTNLVSYIDDGAVLGYGSTNGGKIIVDKAISKENLVDDDNYLIDKTNNKLAISKIDENSLLYLKDKLSLDYYHMNNFSTLKNKINKIKKMAKESLDDPLYYDKDLYFYFSFVMLCLLIYEMYSFRRNEQ